ncbi:MAG: DNA mismatch endonuclease Vsr, partial [Elusimicrobia bacterium]|nr:DNA mismatch endonuclease Vsr [Elusimicrobiota bacterium]
VSLFAGCGGTDLGIQGGFKFLGKRYKKHPLDIIYANDIDAAAAEIFNKNFNVNCVVEDIRNIKATDIPDHDILTGGFPCQSFSIVAQNPPRLGYKDEKGKLFFEMCRVLKKKKPMLFIAENVKGILSANKKQAFPLIIKEFEKCGYIVSWHLLNAANYGVPQRRERVFIVGIKKDIGKKYSPPSATHSINGDMMTKKWAHLKEIIIPHSKIEKKYFFSDKAHEGLSKANRKMNKGRAQDSNGVCNTVGAHLAKVSLNSTDPVLKVNGRFRRFTPREVARIQSFPERFKLVGPEPAQYRALGNAIPPVLMWHVTGQALKVISEKISTDNRTAKEKRSHNMARITSKNTSIENILNEELKKIRFTYERNFLNLLGKPDFVFKRKKLAVFCDSEFWHGRNYPACVNRIKSNKPFWENKIKTNIDRDKRVNRELKKLGWQVLRFWDTDIKKSTKNIARAIQSTLRTI